MSILNFKNITSKNIILYDTSDSFHEFIIKIKYNFVIKFFFNNIKKRIL